MSYCFQNKFSGEAVGEKRFHLDDPLVDCRFILCIDVIFRSKKNGIKANQKYNQIVKMYGYDDPVDEISELALVVEEAQR